MAWPTTLERRQREIKPWILRRNVFEPQILYPVKPLQMWVYSKCSAMKFSKENILGPWPLSGIQKSGQIMKLMAVA